MADEPSKLVELRWTKPVVVASVVVLAAAVVFGYIFPRARRAIAVGVVVSPIPPLP